MLFFTQYSRPKEKELEPGGGERLVETAGYVPAEVQISDMLEAGRRLGEYRRDRFDFGSGEEVPEDYFDPTRSRGFDLADASRLQHEVTARFSEQEAKAEEVNAEPRIPNKDEDKK